MTRDRVLDSPHHWFGKHFLFVSSWKPFYVPAWSKCNFSPFWFGLPKLPFEFMDPDVLQQIGNSFGTFVTSKLDFVEGEVLVKICVLLMPKTVYPRTCNIKSHDGIWCETIEKLESELLKSLLIIDAPLFMDFKKKHQVMDSIDANPNSIIQSQQIMASVGKTLTKED